MPTITLTPTTYYLSSTSYLSVSSASNMYADCDSDTYATVTNSRTSTTSYYLYVRGFDLSQVPSDAIVSDVAVRVKARHSGGYAQAMYLYDGTSTSYGSSSTTLSTTATTHEINVTHDWADLAAAGSDLGIRINCRRSSRNTTAYVYVYGAEIEVTYTVPTPATVTSTLTGNGTIQPGGAYSTTVGSEYELTITPTDTSETVTVTKDGADVTSQLVAHGSGSSASTVLGAYDLVSGSFNSGESWFEGIVGNGADTSEKTTSNYYSGGSGTIAVFTYEMGMTVPSGATITRVWCEVNGHAESTSNSSEYMCAQLISGSTELSEELNFKSVGTSNSTQTLEATTLPTVAQLAAMKLRCRLGYYGGAINGATAHVEYETGAGVTHYTLSFEVTGDHAVAVTIGGAGPELYVKQGGSWVQVTHAYRKTNGAWAPVALDSAFDSTKRYRRSDA